MLSKCSRVNVSDEEYVLLETNTFTSPVSATIIWFITVSTACCFENYEYDSDEETNTKTEIKRILVFIVNNFN